MSRGLLWREPAWFCFPAHRLRFEAALAVAVTAVRAARPSRPRRGGYAVRFVVAPAGVEPRRVTVEFGPACPEVPHVYVDGHTDSPHRYNDGSLCMWYPYDERPARWVRRDGAAVLAGHIAAHLIREAWWRETGEWVGEEVPHGP